MRPLLQTKQTNTSKQHVVYLSTLDNLNILYTMNEHSRL